MRKSEQRPNISIGGKVTGQIVNIGGEMTISGKVNITNNSAPQTDLEKLKAEIEQLKKLISALPASDDTKRLQKTAQAVIGELEMDKINPDEVKESTNKLTQAANNISGALPAVTGIALNAVSIALRMAGLG
jgi:flagellar capping protein FliD